MKHTLQEYLVERGILKSTQGEIAFNSITVDDTHVLISGNKQGLLILADYIVDIALSEAGSHIHLDADNFFDEVSKEVIIQRVD